MSTAALPLIKAHPWATVGAGGHAKQVLEAAARAGFPKASGFFDSLNKTPLNSHSLGLPCLGGTMELEVYANSKTHAIALAFGNNADRLALARKLHELGAEILTIIDPTSVCSPDSVIGSGTVVLARAVVGPSCVIGRGCIINAGALLPHDNVIEDGAHLAPGSVLGGNVRVGAGTLIGLGAVIRNGITVGRNCVVGAGAVVVVNIPDGQTVVGNPAKLMKKKS